MQALNVPSQADFHPRKSLGLSQCARWPIGRAAMAVLIDLSMSDEKIANYFGVTVNEVADKRRQYGLNQDSGKRPRHDVGSVA